MSRLDNVSQRPRRARHIHISIVEFVIKPCVLTLTSVPVCV